MIFIVTLYTYICDEETTLPQIYPRWICDVCSAYIFSLSQQAMYTRVIVVNLSQELCLGVYVATIHPILFM